MLYPLNTVCFVTGMWPSAVTLSPNTTGLDADEDLQDFFLQYEYTEWKVASNMAKYWAPIILFSGTCLNIISFMMYSTKTLSGSVTSFFFRVLAVADTLCLHMGLWQGWLRNIGVPNYTATSDASCRIYQYL